ncbi:ATP-dependent nuclease [Pseudomonas syringae]
MPKIRRITIENFRSIKELSMEATDLTVIVGDNDCGKSNVLRALNLFFNDQTNPDTPFSFLNDYNRYSEPKAKRAAEILVELRLELPESYRENNGDYICWRKRWRADGLQSSDEYWGIRRQKKQRGQGYIETRIEISSRSRVHSLLNRIEFEYVPAVRSADFFRRLRGRIFEVIAQASEHIVRNSSGQFERVISDSVSELLKDISTELQDESTLSLPNDLTPIFESLDFLSGEKLISLENRGDGIKARYIPLILKFIAEKSRLRTGIAPTFIWAYEEPENNLEFRRAQSLSDAFKKLAEDEFSQVILTTHSPIFYNMHLDDENRDLCTAYHLVHEGPARGTSATLATAVITSLDESMGTMAIIAPHIKQAQNALIDATNQATDLKEQLEKHNPHNLPTLFVEGATEYKIFKTILQKFRPEEYGKIFLVEPPSRAGANYVTNMLRSWEYRTKHITKNSRQIAVGVVDADNEGLNAKGRFESESKWGYAFILSLHTPAHLNAPKKMGIDIPVTLEELWPKDQWDIALEKKWLEKRDRKNIFEDQFISRLTDDDLRLSDVMDDEWSIYFENCANSDIDAHAKIQWAEHIISNDDETLESIAVEILKTLDRVIDKMGINK